MNTLIPLRFFLLTVLFCISFFAKSTDKHYAKTKQLVGKANDCIINMDKCYAPGDCIKILYSAREAASKVEDSVKRNKLLGIIYNDIAHTFVNSSFDKCDSLSRIAISYFSRAADWRGVSLNYLQLGYRYSYYSDLDNLKSTVDTAFYYAKKATESKNKLFSMVYYNYASIALRKGNFKEAFENIYQAKGFSNLSGDSMNISMNNFLLARIHYDLQKYGDAAEYAQRAISIFPDKAGEVAEKINMYDLLGQSLISTGETQAAINVYESCLEYAVQKDQKCGALQAYTGIGNALMGTGSWKRADKYFEMSKRMSDETGSRPAFYLVSLSKLYALLGQTDKSLRLIEEFFRTNHSDLNTISHIDVYKDISLIYRKAGQFEKALGYHMKWGDLSDSLRSLENRLMLAEVERKYEIGQKDKMIATQQLALSESHNQRLWLGGILLFVCIGGSASFFLFKGKAIRQKQSMELGLKRTQLKDVLLAQEAERRRIARELHDGIGQSLAALKMQIQAPNALQDTIKSIQKIDTLCKEVRMLSHQMMPLALEEHGLEKALKTLVEQSFSYSGIEAHFISDGFEHRIQTLYEVHLYRISQELISNILKHAQATQVGIQLLQNENRVVLIAEDNGKGFSFPVNKMGIGLSNIASRLETLQGEIETESEPGSGTFVRITIPLKSEENKMIA